MRQKLLIIVIGLVLVLPLLVQAQDTEPGDDLLVPLVTAVPTQAQTTDDPAQDPCHDSDPNDLVVPLCSWTATPPPPTPTPYPWPVPVDGLYSRRYVDTTTRSGDCSDYRGGDNDGPGGDYYDPEDPGQQAYVCTWPQRGIALVDHNTFYWRNGQYTTDTEISPFDGSTSSRVLNVISPTELEIVFTVQAGTCTLRSAIRYELIKAGTVYGCTTTLPEESQEDPTPEPDEVSEEEPEVIQPPTVIEGQYTVRWLPFDSDCDLAYAPDFTELTLVKGSEADIMLYIGGETFALSGERIRGDYAGYFDQLNVSLNRRFADDFNLVWQASSEDYSDACFAQGVVSLGAPLTPEERDSLDPLPPALPAEPGPITINPDGTYHEDTPLPVLAPVSLTEGDYSGTWSFLEGACDSEELVPDFTQVSVTQASATTYLITYEGGSYTLEDYGGVVLYSGNANGYTESFMIDRASDSQISATFAKISDSGNGMCMATVNLRVE